VHALRKKSIECQEKVWNNFLLKKRVVIYEAGEQEHSLADSKKGMGNCGIRKKGKRGEWSFRKRICADSEEVGNILLTENHESSKKRGGDYFAPGAGMWAKRGRGSE